MSAPAPDPVTLEVVRNALYAIAEEMSVIVMRSARSPLLKEAGDLLPALEKGRLHAGALVELGEVIAGTRPGRTSSKQTTLFESQGMAMQDLIIAAELARIARERGMGEELPLGM